MATVILLGASTRAAAMSVRRAGWTPWCADLFADADLERIATVRRVTHYPRGLIDALADAPPGPVIYTGALENRPDLIARIDRPLWGNPPDVLHKIRNPRLWTECLHAARLPCPAISEQPRTDGRWLLKPRRSAGGLGIVPYAGQVFDPHTHYLQEWLDGTPASAIFVAIDNLALMTFTSAQLVGARWCNADPFQYAGSIGPLGDAMAADGYWRTLGHTLAATFRLRGLFGVDAIMRDGIPWAVEINPRYPASLEIAERCLGAALLPWHAHAFGCALPATGPRGSFQTWGKAILYARQTFAFPADGPWRDSLADGIDLDATEYADIPRAGDVIEQGRPVLTMFASAENVADCERKLQEKAQALDRRLWG